MDDPRLEVRLTADKGCGLFAAQPIRCGERIVAVVGWLATGDDLKTLEEQRKAWNALQVGPDLWLCSEGENLDDYINHSCDPNAGFTTGEPVLFALRDIDPGEEIGFDYSTSLSEPGWSLRCRCSAASCRNVIRPWAELAGDDRIRLRPIALQYLWEMG
jgi:SET domain-containing protein